MRNKMDVMKIKVTVYLKGQGVIEGFELDTTPRLAMSNYSECLKNGSTICIYTKEDSYAMINTDVVSHIFLELEKK